MSGASDDWAYEHMGLFSWTTEFWDIVFHATGKRSPTDVWYIPPPPDVELAVCKWTDLHAPGSYAHWEPFDHPQLGQIEIGGCDYTATWTNPPKPLLLAEVAPHVDFAIYQALASPRLEIKLAEAICIGSMGDINIYNVRVGVANTGWLGTTVSKLAEKNKIVLPITLQITGAELVEGVTKVQLGQLAGRSQFCVNGCGKSDGTPDRALSSWIVKGVAGQQVTLTASHPRAGTTEVILSLPVPVVRTPALMKILSPRSKP